MKYIFIISIIILCFVSILNINNTANIKKEIKLYSYIYEERERLDKEISELKKKIIAEKSKEKMIELFSAKEIKEENIEKIETDYFNTDFTSERKTIIWKLPIQKKDSNTCVLENLSFITNQLIDKKINIDLVYKDMNKNIWDYWKSWQLVESSIWYKWRDVDGSKDYTIFSEITGIKLKESSLAFNLKKLIKEEEGFATIDLPMYLIDNNKKWLEEKNKNIYHSITILHYNNNDDTFEFLNTLTGNIEILDAKKIYYDEKGRYLKYPFKYIDNIEELYNNKYLK